MAGIPFRALIAATAAVSMVWVFAPSPDAIAAQPFNAAPVRLQACQACHGVDGIATLDGAPNLAGQPASYLGAQLMNFRSKDRKHELMNAIASQLDDDEIAAFARYWSGQPSTGTLGADARTAAAVASDVTFPSTFPDDFEVYRINEDMDAKMVVRDWANRAALDAARAGKPLQDDAVVVVETLSARMIGTKLVADAPLSYAVFAARAGWGDRVPELLRNGNWQFGAFSPDRTPQLKNQAVCLACHKPQVAKSFMFTYDELAAHASEQRK